MISGLTYSEKHCSIAGVSNSNVLEGHISKKKDSAEAVYLKKAFAGHNLREKL
jgi:hypothetical protein